MLWLSSESNREICIRHDRTNDCLQMRTTRRRAVDVSGVCRSNQSILWRAFAPFESEIRSCSILLIHTGWSNFWSTPTYFDHPFLDREVASKLLECGVKVVGIDTLSPDETVLDGSEGSYAVHETLLGAGAVIAEAIGIDLNAIGLGVFRFFAVAFFGLIQCQPRPGRSCQSNTRCWGSGHHTVR